MVKVCGVEVTWTLWTGQSEEAAHGLTPQTPSNRIPRRPLKSSHHPTFMHCILLQRAGDPSNHPRYVDLSAIRIAAH
jgi:hypothetical protein